MALTLPRYAYRMLLRPPIEIHDGPPVRRNGWANYLGVNVYREAPTPGAVLIHECMHWQFIWRLLLLALIPAIGLGLAAWHAGSEFLAMAAVICMVPGFLFKTWCRHCAQVNEARAKMVESYVGHRYYGWDLNAYMLLEAISMVNGGYPQFKGWGREEAIAALKEQMRPAMYYVDANRSFIERKVEELPDVSRTAGG